MAEAGHETSPCGIVADAEDKRNRCGGALDDMRRRCGGNNDHVHPAANKICGQFRDAIRMIFGPPVLDGNILPVHMTGLTKASAKCVRKVRVGLRRTYHKDADDWHRLLRTSSERPCDC